MIIMRAIHPFLLFLYTEMTTIKTISFDIIDYYSTIGVKNNFCYIYFSSLITCYTTFMNDNQILVVGPMIAEECTILWV